MSLQPLHLPDYPHVRIMGDVQIDPTVAIAPGVILQAAPGCKISLGRGVCLGMGVIIKSYGGDVQLDEGVSLGPGVLIMGPSHLASNVCVGGLSTLWHSNVEPLTVLPAGSLLGDPSRLVAHPEPDITSQSPAESSPVTDDLWAKTEPDAPPISPSLSKLEVLPEIKSDQSDSTDTVEETPVKAPGHPAYGKVMLDQLLVTLFPHKIEIGRSPQE